MLSCPYCAEMLSEKREQPRFMFTNKLIRNETYPIFQQRLTLVPQRKFYNRRYDPPKIFLGEATVDKIENLRLNSLGEWQDELARQTLIHQKLKAVHFSLEADPSIYEHLDYGELQHVSGPFRLSSFYSFLCASVLCSLQETWWMQIPIAKICKRYAVSVTIQDWDFQCFKKCFLDEQPSGYMQYSGRLSVIASFEYTNPQLIVDYLDIEYHANMTARKIRPNRIVTRADDALGEYEWEQRYRCEMECFFSILLLRELETMKLLDNDSAFCEGHGCEFCER